MKLNGQIFGSSRKVRERNRKKSNESEEEMIVSVTIGQAFGDFDFVVEALKPSC